MSESDLLRALLVESSTRGLVLMRNNVGTLRDIHGTYVRYGLCVGSSDLIGWLPVTITAEMVGRQLAVFCAIEAKTATGRVSPEQRAFLAAVERAGGIARVVRAVEDLNGLLL